MTRLLPPFRAVHRLNASGIESLARVTIYDGCEHPVSVPAFLTLDGLNPAADSVQVVTRRVGCGLLSFNQFFSPK